MKEIIESSYFCTWGPECGVFVWGVCGVWVSSKPDGETFKLVGNRQILL